jgi:7-cyano-7-deazaguanine synthase
MKETVVPNRNKIFSSLIQAVALSVATKTTSDDCTIGREVAIAMGIHKGDEAVYPDCRAEFRDADLYAFKVGNWDSELVSYYTPYLEVMKYDILHDGAESCNKLGLDFNEVYKRTNTSYKPYPSGNSDYKSAASVERIEAFIKLGRPDPVQYEDESGEVSWEVAKAHVEQVLETWKNR